MHARLCIESASAIESSKRQICDSVNFRTHFYTEVRQYHLPYASNEIRREILSKRTSISSKQARSYDFVLLGRTSILVRIRSIPR